MKHGLANMKRKRKRGSYLFVLVLFFKKLILIYVKFHADFFFPHCCVSLGQKVCMPLVSYGDCTMSSKADYSKKPLF